MNVTRPLNRIVPRIGPDAYKTYAILAPHSTHFRPAACAEVDCPAYLAGWRTAVDERTQLGQGQAYYIRRQSGRAYREHRNAAGLTVFTFEPGQRCFHSDDHRVRLDRPELYVVKGGDWRGNPRGTQMVTHSSPDSWMDDFATHQQTLADAQQKG